jgi:predicted ATPase with chaperone activity
VVKVDPHATTGSASNDRREHSAGVRTRVELARLFAAERADKEGLMGGAFADKAARQIIEADANMRRVDAVLRVARTIADLAGSAEIQDVHAREAEQYVPRSTKATFKVRRMAPVADGV